MRAVAELSITRPRMVLATVAALTLLALWACTRVTFDTSTERLLVQDSDAWRFAEATRRTFGGDETLFLIVQRPDVLSPAAVRELAALTRAAAAVPEVERTLSIATLRWPWSEDGDVAVKPLFDDTGMPTPGAPVSAAVQSPLVAQNLVSSDRKVAAVLVWVSPHPEDRDYKRRLVMHVEAAVATAAPDATVLLGGAPVAQVALSQLTAQDLRLLGPAAAVLMALILAFTYRRARGVWLPLATVFVSLIWTIALTGVLGRSLSIVSSVIPPLILAIGTSYAVRVLSEYERQRTLSTNHEIVLQQTLREVGIAVLLCGATTSLGFFALMVSRVEVVRDLGLIAASGSLFTTFAALTIVPAALALSGKASTSKSAELLQRRFTSFLTSIHRLTVRHGLALMLMSMIIGIFGLRGLAFLRVDQNPYAWFPVDSPIAHSTALLDEQLGGVTPFGIVLESPQGVFDPALLQAADRVAERLRAEHDVGAVVTPTDHLRVMDQAFGGGGGVPKTSALAAQFALLYELGDARALSPYMSEQRHQLQVVVRMKHYSSSRLSAFATELERDLPALCPPPIEARITGTGLLRIEANDEFTRGLVRHLLLASVAIGTLIAVALRSPWLGVVALVPNLVPILFVYGALGWLGVPLNAATVTTGAAALGNAVDDTVQYLDRYRRRLGTLGDGKAARRAAILSVGIPMIVSDVVLMVGFAVFGLSQFFPVVSLGLLGAGAIALSLLANLLILPALISRFDG